MINQLREQLCSYGVATTIKNNTNICNGEDYLDVDDGRAGIIIHPTDEQAYVYCNGQVTELPNDPAKISDAVLNLLR